MKIEQNHIHFAPTQDEILIVHRPGVMAPGARITGMPRTAEAVHAMSQWIARDTSVGPHKLPPVYAFLQKIMAKILRRPVLTNMGERSCYLPGKLLVFTVREYESPKARSADEA